MLCIKYIAKRDGKVMSLHDSHESANQAVYDSERRDREDMVKSQYIVRRAIVWVIPNWIGDLFK